MTNYALDSTTAAIKDSSTAIQNKSPPKHLLLMAMARSLILLTVGATLIAGKRRLAAVSDNLP